MTPLQPRPGALYRRQEPVRDPAYLKYLRQLPCVTCGTSRRRREAAHIGAHGIGQKASDLDALPLCRECHSTGARSLHKLGPEKFWEAHPFADRPALQRMCRRFFRLRYPDHELTGVPWPVLALCICKHEDFLEEFELRGCPACGRRMERAA